MPDQGQGRDDETGGRGDRQRQEHEQAVDHQPHRLSRERRTGDAAQHAHQQQRHRRHPVDEDG
ncbi:hypothetical protein [Actinomycetospora cinnamomea]|uniref:hypothetical protein n=1 Tax=Actinomycetospora cinnamomea TaxID=663609 RepID=UPI001401D400|nr:hypothetical protein [Actinomycetospora cinnamomea]